MSAAVIMTRLSPDIDNLPTPRLLVLQATSLCNLNCSYCYVPGRRDSRKMEMSVVRGAASFVAPCFSLPGVLDVLWHAGEPLAAGIDFYTEAFSVFRSALPTTLDLTHIMQTNGTLIALAGRSSWHRTTSQSASALTARHGSMIPAAELGTRGVRTPVRCGV